MVALRLWRTTVGGAASACDHRALGGPWNDGIFDQPPGAWLSPLQLPGINSSIRPLFDYGERRVRGVARRPASKLDQRAIENKFRGSPFRRKSVRILTVPRPTACGAPPPSELFQLAYTRTPYVFIRTKNLHCVLSELKRIVETLRELQ